LFVAVIVSNATAVAEMRPADPPATYATSDPFADFVEDASRRFGVPVRWIRAVIDVESAGDVRARSPKGAMGLMQIMPETWAELRLRYNFGSDPYDSHDNILAGTAYLRELHDRYGSPGFLAAYNAGPGRYEEHLAGRPLPAETQAYLQKLAPVIGNDIAASSAVASLRPSPATLFIVWSERRPLPACSLCARRTRLRRPLPFTTSRPLCHRQLDCSSRDLMPEARDDGMRKLACISVLWRRMGGKAMEVGRHDVSVRSLHISQVLT
jgi:hypothetical protein